MLEILILIVISVLILGSLLIYLQRRLGPAIWPFVFILLPASIILILAEAEVARGSLAMMLASVLGAYGIAITLAVALALSAHYLGDALNDYLSNGTNWGASTYTGNTWRHNRLSVAATGFLICALAYGTLGYVRTGYSLALLGSMFHPISRMLFFLFPICSLIIGLFTAMAIRSMRERFALWNKAQAFCATAGIALIGVTSNNETKRILKMLETRVLNGEEPEAILSDPTPDMNFRVNHAQQADQQQPVPAEHELDEEPTAENDARLTLQRQVFSR